jgi:hypothetical protein
LMTGLWSQWQQQYAWMMQAGALSYEIHSNLFV